MTEKKQIALGAFAPPLKTQFEELGISLSTKTISQLQKMDQAITHLSIHSLLTQGEVRKARDRLVKRIREEIRDAS